MADTKLSPQFLEKFLPKLERFLGIRPRSRKEVEDYLLYRRKLEPEIVVELLHTLQEQGVINDHEFTNWYISNRINFSKYGLTRVKQELFQKGVAKETVAEVLKEFDQTEVAEIQTTKLTEEIKKFLDRNHEPDVLKLKQKLFRKLLARGFTYSEINSELNRLGYLK